MDQARGKHRHSQTEEHFWKKFGLEITAEHWVLEIADTNQDKEKDGAS